MIDDVLERLQGPSRFLGNEINAVRKDPAKVEGQTVLLFPDHYDLGMSHLGYKIIYHTINQTPDLLCERAFCPEPELEDQMREHGWPLLSLESGRPIKEFDLIGVTLPHELAATNMLTLLDLAGLPLQAAERGDGDPLVIAGGPGVSNPEPLVQFLDAVFLGDGEEGAVELARLVGRARRAGLSRLETLRRMARIEGLYVPSFYEPVYADGRLTEIRSLDPAAHEVRRIVNDLNESFFPANLIVPYGKPVHDRLAVEPARGCTRGCRFCQAGMLYRPVREREPRILYNQIMNSLKKTGYDEISLLSLSIGDYSCLVSLLASLMERLDPKRVSVSLPSIRADTLTEEAIGLIKRVRVTGLTIAPEAGSQRLRNVINKDLSEEEIIEAVRLASRSGWRLIKLYFMIGLPTETEEDLEALVDLVRLIAKEMPGAKLNVSLSAFVPKAHTPFQWERQISGEEARARMEFVRSRLKSVRGVRIKWNSPLVAQLDGLLSRGDRQQGRVILRAWRNGARFEAWSERFRWEAWAGALEAEGMSLEELLAERPLDQPLPWEHLALIDKEFLLAERAAAFEGRISPDCRVQGCQGCGVCDLEEVKPLTFTTYAPSPTAPPPTKAKPRHLILSYHKLGPARFFGHLETAHIFFRAFRRAGVSMGYSQGFHPQPRLSFFDAIPVGTESLDEWAEVEVIDHRQPEQIMTLVNAQLPEGLKLTTMARREKKQQAHAFLYRISLEEGAEMDPARIEAFLAAGEAPYVRKKPKKNQNVDLRRPVEELKIIDPGELEMTIIPPAKGPTPRPEEVVRYVFGLKDERLRVLRLKTYLGERWAICARSWPGWKRSLMSWRRPCRPTASNRPICSGLRSLKT